MDGVRPLTVYKVNGAKTLVLDPSLAGPLGLVTEVSLLQVRARHLPSFFPHLIATQQHGVDKMFWLESGPLSAVTTSIVYLCRPRIKWVKIIAGKPTFFLLLFDALTAKQKTRLSDTARNRRSTPTPFFLYPERPLSSPEY